MARTIGLMDKPWWHEQIAEWMKDRRKITNCQVVAREDARFPITGYIPCNPEALRQAAGKRMGIKKLPLATYSAARLISRGTTPEEKVALCEIAQNSAKRHKVSFSDNLFHNSHQIRLYGQRGQGRRFDTSQDPTAGDIMIANFVLSGTTADYALKADQFVVPLQQLAALPDLLKKSAWVGPLPGISPWKLLALKHKRVSLSKVERENNQLALDMFRSQEVSNPVEALKKDWKPLAAVLGISTLFAMGTSYAISESHTKRWKTWKTDD